MKYIFFPLSIKALIILSLSLGLLMPAALHANSPAKIHVSFAITSAPINEHYSSNQGKLIMAHGGTYSIANVHHTLDKTIIEKTDYRITETPSLNIDVCNQKISLALNLRTPNGTAVTKTVSIPFDTEKEEEYLADNCYICLKAKITD